MPASPPEIVPPPRAARSAAEIRAWVVAEVARALNVAAAAVDPAAPLDSHGVDSLCAISMTGGLAEWLGRDVPATLMWDYATIDAIAADLADPDADAHGDPPRGVLAFQPLGDRTPLFCFPGVGGHPVTFAGLAQQLGASQPCYGLSVAALDGESEPFDTVEAIAAEMVANLRRVQPRGPYQLAGYSFGGFLAHEAARQLSAAGERISMLAIYDVFTPDGRPARPRWQRLLLHAYLLATRPNRSAYLRQLLGRAIAFARPDDDDGAPDVDAPEAAVHAVRDANLRALAAYSAGAYDGAALFLVAREQPPHAIFFKLDPAGGWRAACAGGVRVITLPGTHLTLFKGEHIRTSADALRPHLLGVESSRSIAA